MNEQISKLTQELTQITDLEKQLKLKDNIEKGEKIITLYSDSKEKLNQAIKYYEEEVPIKFE